MYSVHTQKGRKTADDACHSTPPVTDRLLESSAELCVNGFKKEQDVFKKYKEHLTNFELVVKTNRSAHSLPFEVDAQV